MAKFKKTTAKKSTATKASAIADAERLSRSLSESAQQIWLAGVGAFSRAQAEGTKLFEGLVREGMGLEATVRKVAGGRADLVRDIVENRVGQARERATDTWDKLEKVFEDRVQRALVTLGVPSRDDLNDLTQRVEALTNELRRQGGKPAAAPRTAAKAAKAPAKKATRAAAAKPKKAAAKRAPRKAKAAAPAAE